MAPVQSHPLQIEVIVENVFRHLDSYMDLMACYEVCKLWKEVAPPFILQCRPSVHIDKNMNAMAYAQATAVDPKLKVTKLKLNNAALNSGSMKRLLAKNGTEIEKIDLSYTHPADTDSLEEHQMIRILGILGRLRPDIVARRTILMPQLRDLLVNKLPFLETLIISALPSHIYRRNLFPNYAKMDPSSHLFLKKIGFSLSMVPRIGEGFSEEFLIGLFAMCPKLEEIEASEAWDRFLEPPIGETPLEEKIVRALVDANRFKQLKALKLHEMKEELVKYVGSHLTTGQLRELQLRRLSRMEHIDVPRNFEQLLFGQRCSLKNLTIPDMGYGWILPPMPNLLHLKIIPATKKKSFLPELAQRVGGAINYAVDFPKLQLLELDPNLVGVGLGALFPASASAARKSPASSVRTLQNLPIGVDKALMAKIGRVFSNLSILRTPIPFKYEDLLVSVWSKCRNLTELFLQFESDASQDADNAVKSNPAERSLDSIFSGISEDDCRRLRTFSDGHLEKLDLAVHKTEKSLCNLKKLRKLCLGGPGKAWGVVDNNQQRQDKLTSVTGLSTFALMSKELVFLQVDLGMISVKPACTSWISEKTGLKLQSDGDPRLELQLLRFIKTEPDYGFGALGTYLPGSWYGIRSPEGEDELMNMRLIIAQSRVAGRFNF